MAEAHALNFKPTGEEEKQPVGVDMRSTHPALGRLDSSLQRQHEHGEQRLQGLLAALPALPVRLARLQQLVDDGRPLYQQLRHVLEETRHKQTQGEFRKSCRGHRIMQLTSAGWRTSHKVRLVACY